MSETEQSNNMAYTSPFNTPPIIDPKIARMLAESGEPSMLVKSAYSNMYQPDDGGVGYYNEMTGGGYPDDPRVFAGEIRDNPFSAPPSAPAPSFGNYDMQMGAEYEKQIYGEGQTQFAGPNKNKMLPKFDPSSGADWMRGLGLFAKGAIFGKPETAGPAPTTSQSGKDVSKESTFDQKDYWGWLFNS
jgi:hypothetical protein